MSTTMKNVASKSAPSVLNGKPHGGPGSGGFPKKKAAEKKAPPKEETAEDPRDKRLSPAMRLTRKVIALHKRINGLFKVTTHWGNKALTESLDSLLDQIQDVESIVSKIPGDFKPSKRGGKDKPHLAPGTKVRLTDKAKPKYEDGTLEPEEREADLDVLLIIKNKVRVKAPNGVIFVLPRGHVAPVATKQVEG